MTANKFTYYYNHMLLNITDINDLAKEELSISALDRIWDQIVDHAITLGLKLIVAVIAYIIGRWIIKWLRKFIARFLERRRVETTVKSFIDSFSDIMLKIILFLVIVNILGISLTSFAAILAAFGLAVGMAMKDNLSNFAGGVMILINKPFKAGDRIIVQGMDGVVQSIGILYTVMLTGDNKTIYIPNGPLSTGNITNFSNQADRRIDITLSFSYGVDIEDIKNSIQDIISKEPLIKDTPQPFIGVTMVNNGSIDMTIRVWVKNADYSSVNVSLNESIYTTFSQKGIYVASTLSVKLLKN